MKLTRIFSAIPSLMAVAVLSACGGAPDYDSGDVNSDVLITINDVPTYISLSIQPDVEGTQDFDGTEVDINVYVTNLVGQRAKPGYLANFTAQGGALEESCLIDEASGCTVKWTSVVNSYPNGSSQETIGLLVMVPGAAEPFMDLNANELYDAGEPLLADYPEPFRDDNGSGTWELGEFFHDTNKNGTWDTANGEWDGPCNFTSIVCDTPDGIVLFSTWPMPLLPTETESGT
ncbi:hypothetical protein [Agaribacterium sp. ZY112]|uniref:hypothetical protein n=1 Tax=Agaribacterium sp. ZY112 TaxID=3233574 RepID=UPI003525A0AD